MVFTVHKKDDANLPVEKTYGEKMHDLIFNKLINFWTTLAISGLFVFWVKHSDVPIPFLGNKRPREFHTNVREWFSKQGMFKMLPGGNEVARVTADALTINLPGIATILPSAWLGNKFKTPIVEALDKMHYGDDAEQDPRIAERHRVVETERKPSLLGATLARAGGMTAGVFTGYLIGAPRGQNMVSLLGKNEKMLAKLPGLKVLEKFDGVDSYALTLGDKIGGFISGVFPKFSGRLDSFFRKAGISWDPHGGASQTHAEGELYNRSTRDWGKWTSADVMYTIVTSTTIGPFVALIGKLPFMGYHEKPHARVPMPSHPIMPQASMMGSNTDTNSPQSRVSQVQAAERINPQLETQLNG